MNPKTITIFRAGRQTSLNGTTLDFSTGDLAATAAAYKADVHEAPLVIGHPALDAPAYGWVGGLNVQGNLLQATLRQVEPAFAELVNDGRFKKVSASFYLPDSPRNPAPGTYYLRHVGFLGAQPPAVKGLPAIAFGEGGEDTISIDFTEETASMMTKEELEARQRVLDEREQQLNARGRELRQKEFASFADGLVREGTLLPAEKAGVVVFMETIQEGEALAFAEEKIAPLDWFKRFLANRPKAVTFGEYALAKGGVVPPPASAPHGFTVDPGRAALHAQALAFAEQNKVDYVTAVMRLEGGVK